MPAWSYPRTIVSSAQDDLEVTLHMHSPSFRKLIDECRQQSTVRRRHDYAVPRMDAGCE